MKHSGQPTTIKGTDNMINLIAKVDISDEMAHLLYEGREDAPCTFVYCHKSGRETECHMSLGDAVRLAEARRFDGRYKNFNYYIC